jgi:hypothetical protein
MFGSDGLVSRRHAEAVLMAEKGETGLAVRTFGREKRRKQNHDDEGR